jgi:hypothetical protein
VLSRVLLHSALGDDDAIVGVTMQVQIRHSFQKRVEWQTIKARSRHNDRVRETALRDSTLNEDGR